jgi:fructosamine-3-kinase
VRRNVDQLAARLDDILYEPEQPALIHGDMWGGNVLPDNGRIAGFVDPAIYYAHPEIELAFSTLFSTYGKPFFRRYEEIRPLQPDFFEERRDVYNLYPLLVHVRLFGGSYVGQVKRILSRYA